MKIKTDQQENLGGKMKLTIQEKKINANSEKYFLLLISVPHEPILVYSIKPGCTQLVSIIKQMTQSIITFILTSSLYLQVYSRF